jgi:hypothetical protein
MKVTVHITETGETYDRDMTEEELVQAQLDAQLVKRITGETNDLED